MLLVSILAFGAIMVTKSYFQSSFKRLEMRQDEIVREIQNTRGKVSPSLTQPKTFDAMQEIEQLKKEVSQLREQVEESDSIIKFVPSSTTSISPTASFYQQIKAEVGYVTISDSKWAKVDVFQDKNTSSKIVGQAQYGVTYPFSKKESGYYFIELSKTLSGWIHGQFVRERK